MSGRFKLRFRSLVFFTLSFFVGIQLVSFIWLHSRGKRDNSSQGFQYQNRMSNKRPSPSEATAHMNNNWQEPRVFNPSPRNSKILPKVTSDEATSKMESQITNRNTRSSPLRDKSSLTMARTNSNSSKPTTASVDMENEYYPFVNFSFVWPETTPDLNGEREYFLVVLVNSAAKGTKYRARRNAIRKTWANMSNCDQKNMANSKVKHRWILAFSLGKTDNETENEANLDEARRHNDLLIGDFHDNYLNNVVKVYMGELWVSTMNVRYILKTDDDVYVRVPSVIEYLVAQKYPRSFYGGAPYFNFKVDRNPKGKWAVSKRYFSEEIFPTFCAGAFYVLSTDILSQMFNYVRRRKPFHTDDAYVGIAARDLGIPVIRIPGLLVEDNMPIYLGSFNDCRLLKARAFGHSIEPPLMNKVFNRLNELCLKRKTC